MHNVYVVVLVGEPRSDCMICGPFPHFHLIWSLASSLLSEIWRLASGGTRQVVAGLGSLVQPPTGSHESWVHTFPSSQSSGAAPGTHVPVPSQASPPLQTLPSSQAVLRGS